jgi:hypothetical protein
MEVMEASRLLPLEISVTGRLILLRGLPSVALQRGYYVTLS